jgi:hypothetical protein
VCLLPRFLNSFPKLCFCMDVVDVDSDEDEAPSISRDDLNEALVQATTLGTGVAVTEVDVFESRLKLMHDCRLRIAKHMPGNMNGSVCSYHLNAVVNNQKQRLELTSPSRNARR